MRTKKGKAPYKMLRATEFYTNPDIKFRPTKINSKKIYKRRPRSNKKES